MSGKFTYTASLILGVLSLVLVVADMALISSNRHLQDTANQRQAEINRGNSLSNLNQSLIQALAEAATSGNDAAIKGLLTSQGITVKQNPADAAKTPAEPKK